MSVRRRHKGTASESGTDGRGSEAAGRRVAWSRCLIDGKSVKGTVKKGMGPYQSSKAPPPRRRARPEYYDSSSSKEAKEGGHGGHAGRVVAG